MGDDFYSEIYVIFGSDVKPHKIYRNNLSTL